MCLSSHPEMRRIGKRTKTFLPLSYFCFLGCVPSLHDHAFRLLLLSSHLIHLHFPFIPHPHLLRFLPHLHSSPPSSSIPYSSVLHDFHEHLYLQFGTFFSFKPLIFFQHQDKHFEHMLFIWRKVALFECDLSPALAATVRRDVFLRIYFTLLSFTACHRCFRMDADTELPSLAIQLDHSFYISGRNSCKIN